MAKTESTAINNLIELTATATPLKPAPGDDLMFAEPAKRSASKAVSVPRMSATLTNAAPVEPLPRGRGAAGTQQNALTPPGVRITTAPPSRAVTIPPMPPTRSSAGITPPAPPAPRTTSRPSLPPPVRQSAAMVAAVTGAPLLTPPPTDPSFDPAPLAPIDLTDQSWFEESRAVDRVTGPVSESTWVGTVQMPKQSTTAQWLGKLALPMGAMIVIGIFVGGYVAFDGEGGHKRGPQVAAAAPATADLAKAAPADGEPATANAATGDLAKTEPAATEPVNPAATEPASATGDLAKTEPASATGDVANTEPAKTTEPALAKTEPALAKTEPALAKAAPAVTPPNLAAATAVPAAAAPAVANGKTVFVDVRLDSKPSGATVMLVDRGKTMFLGTTPISTALDPSRQYDVVFTYKDRPTVLEHIDPRTQSKLAVTLNRSGSKSAAAPVTEVAKPAKIEAPKTEAPKAEAPKAIAKEAPKTETPKAEAPKAEAPKAEAPKAVAKEAPKAETPKAGGEGVLMVSSKPPCEIYVDGKATGLMTPQRSLPLSAGPHKITLINSAEKIKKTLTVQITADQPTKLIQDLMAK